MGVNRVAKRKENASSTETKRRTPKRRLPNVLVPPAQKGAADVSAATINGAASAPPPPAGRVVGRLGRPFTLTAILRELGEEGDCERFRLLAQKIWDMAIEGYLEYINLLYTRLEGPLERVQYAGGQGNAAAPDLSRLPTQDLRLLVEIMARAQPPTTAPTTVKSSPAEEEDA